MVVIVGQEWNENLRERERERERRGERERERERERSSLACVHQPQDTIYMYYNQICLQVRLKSAKSILMNTCKYQ